MTLVIAAVLTLAVLHVVQGLLSISLGVASSIQAEVWLAHTLSPIWSGACWTFTGILAFAGAKRKTAYLIMCFTGFTIVSLVTAIVSIQLLRLGLVNHTTDGHTFEKENKDILIIIALAVAGSECIVSVISSVTSCRLAKEAKKELYKKREDTFHVQVLGQKDIVVVTKKKNKKKRRKHSKKIKSHSVEEVEILNAT